MDFVELLNMIAKELPEQFKIVIEVENGYAGVKLVTPVGDDVECVDNDLSIFNKVNFLITVAKDWEEDNTEIEESITVNGL